MLRQIRSLTVFYLGIPQPYGLKRDRVEEGAEWMACIAFLLLRGCDLRALFAILDLATELQARDRKLALPKTRAIKSLAKKMRRLAREIRNVESMMFMSLLDRRETQKISVKTRTRPDAIDDLSYAFPFIAVPKWIEKRAEMYDEWALLASSHAVPKKTGLERLSRLVLPLYVEYATGRPHFPIVIQLLEYSKFNLLNAVQLSREITEFKRDHPQTWDNLKFQFKTLSPPDSKATTFLGGGYEQELKDLETPLRHRVRRSSTHSANSAGSNCH